MNTVKELTLGEIACVAPWNLAGIIMNIAPGFLAQHSTS